MTHITIIGNNSKKLIEFKKALNSVTGEMEDVNYEEEDRTPSSFKFIELICKNHAIDYDLMFAHDGDRSKTGVLYLGYFNDGIVY